MIAVIRSQNLTDLYNKIANKLSPGQEITVKKVKYISPNFPRQNEKVPQIEDAQISLKKTPKKRLELSLKMSSKVDFTFKAEVQQANDNDELELGKIIGQLNGKTEMIGKDHSDYLSAEREIEAALTERNLERLWEKLTSGTKSSSRGFGK